MCVWEVRKEEEGVWLHICSLIVCAVHDMRRDETKKKLDISRTDFIQKKVFYVKRRGGSNSYTTNFTGIVDWKKRRVIDYAYL